MTRKGQDRTGSPPTGGAAAARDARLRAALRENLARRKARAHALARPAAPSQDEAADRLWGVPAPDPAPDPDTAPVAGTPTDADIPTDPAKDH